MEDRTNSENEELRKQIQFLTDIIKHAKSGKQCSYQTQRAAVPYKSAYSSQSKYSKPYRSSFHGETPHPKAAVYNRNLPYPQPQDLYGWDPSKLGSGVRENSSVCDTKHTETASVKSEDLKDAAMYMKSASSSKSSDEILERSDSKVLKTEIEEMKSKITELKQLISERKSTHDLAKRKIHNKLAHSGSSGCSYVNCGVSAKESNLDGNIIPSIQGKFEKEKSYHFITESCNSSKGVFKRDSSVSPRKVISDKYERMSDVSGAVLNPKSRQTNENCVNYRNSQPHSDLVSVSKYKLTRVGPSPTKQSQSLLYGSVNQAVSLASRKPGNVSVSVEPAIVSAKKQNVKSDLSLGSGLNTGTPAKFVKKSKYSITRVKNSGKKNLSRNKLVRSHSTTPGKFIRFSKYAIRRVRRSFSDESKQSSKNNTSSVKGTRNYENLSIRTGKVHGDTVVKSKYKMEKVPLTSLLSRNNYKLPQSAQYYRFDRNKLYRQKSYQLYKQGYKIRPHWSERFGHYGFYKRGRYNTGYRQQARNYRGYVGRYQKAFQHPVYNRQPTFSHKYIQRRIQMLKQEVPFNPKHRLDRRTAVADSRRHMNFVMINGMLYKSSAKTLQKAVTPKTSRTSSQHLMTIKKSATSNMKTVTVRGVKFAVDGHGRSLKRVTQPGTSDGKGAGTSAVKSSQVSRIDIGGVTYIQTKPGTLERVASVKSRMAAARVVNKTVQQAAVKKYKKDNTRVKKKKKYCMFYNRFGKCNKKGDCPYIHDPEKVAVCTRFLRGTCKVKDCPFSHKVSKDKMPVCSYFLKGVCNRDSCPYLHVNVNKDAEICGEFLKGYCPRAEKCTKKHILKCPEFAKTGVCSKGENCKLQHRKAYKRSNPLPEESILEQSKRPKLSIKDTEAAIDSGLSAGSCSKTENSTETSEQEITTPDCDSSKPFKERKLPAYISLITSSTVKKEDSTVIDVEKEKMNVKPALRIRPQL